MCEEEVVIEYLPLTLPVRIPGEEEKINLNLYFHTSLWYLKRFHRP